jgi:DNA-binding NarL/FixJ family response regulator
MSIRILLADDHVMFRQGLCSLLSAEKDMEIVAQAQDGREAVELCGKVQPHLVVMDITMPGLNGIEATRMIRSQWPGVKIIALSMHSTRRFMSEALKAGASGYLLKDGSFQELLAAIAAVMEGKSYLSPSVTNTVVDDYVRHVPEARRAVTNALTAREREVLQLIAEGGSTKEIAHRLHVSVKTIETHRAQIMSKLRIHSIAGLTKYAINEGLTSPEP